MQGSSTSPSFAGFQPPFQPSNSQCQLPGTVCAQSQQHQQHAVETLPWACMPSAPLPLPDPPASPGLLRSVADLPPCFRPVFESSFRYFNAVQCECFRHVMLGSAAPLLC